MTDPGPELYVPGPGTVTWDGRELRWTADGAPEQLAPAGTPMGTACAVHRHAEWVPQNEHHVWPKGLGGPDTPGNRVTLCMNAHGAVHEFIRRLIATAGSVPAADAAHFPPKVRDLALAGWQQAGRPTHGHSGE